MKRSLGTALLVFFGLAGPALATGSISCSSADGASIDLSIGHVPVAAILAANVIFGDTVWTTDGDISVGQQFSNDDTFIADFTDPNIERIMVSLRLFSATEGERFAMAGTLTLEGIGAFAVVCDEP